MKKVFVILTAIFCLAVFSACGGESVDPTLIVGSWSTSNDEFDATYTFKSDGTFTDVMTTKGFAELTMDDKGTYEIKGGELFLTKESYNATVSYIITIDGDKMEWKNSDGKLLETYTKE